MYISIIIVVAIIHRMCVCAAFVNCLELAKCFAGQILYEVTKVDFVVCYLWMLRSLVQ